MAVCIPAIFHSDHFQPALKTWSCPEVAFLKNLREGLERSESLCMPIWSRCFMQPRRPIPKSVYHNQGSTIISSGILPFHSPKLLLDSLRIPLPNTKETPGPPRPAVYSWQGGQSGWLGSLLLSSYWYCSDVISIITLHLFQRSHGKLRMPLLWVFINERHLRLKPTELMETTLPLEWKVGFGFCLFSVTIYWWLTIFQALC